MVMEVVAGVCFDNNRMLSVYSKGAWYHPGGRREDGETDEDCLLREIREELGVGVKKGTIRYYKTLNGVTHSDGTPISLAFYFFQPDSFDIKPSMEVERTEWLSLREIRDGRVLTPLMREVVTHLEIDGYFGKN